MAVPVFESKTLTEFDTETTSPTFDMPATRPDDDLYIALLYADGNSSYSSPPGNWTSFYSVTPGAEGPRIAGYWWIGDTEPATYSITSGNEKQAGVIVRLSGTHLTDPVDVVGTDSGNTGATNQFAPDITTTVDLTLVLRVLGADNVFVTAPTTSIQNGATAGPGGVGYGASRETGPNPAGVTGTAQFSHSSAKWSSGTFSIKGPDAGAFSFGSILH